MLKIQVVKREVVKVDFGKIGDPQRIAKIVGSLTHYYDLELDPSRFEPALSDPEPWRSRDSRTRRRMDSHEAASSRLARMRFGPGSVTTST